MSQNQHIHMNTDIHNIITDINSTERYSDENKAAWRSLFQAAKLHAYKIRTRGKYINKGLTVPRDTDEIMVSIIVDQWMAEYNDHYIEHSSPQDNRHTGDCSCVQAMEQAAKTDAIAAIKEVFTGNSTNTRLRQTIRDRLHSQIAGSSPRLAEFLKHASDQWLADNASEIVDKYIRYTSCDITTYTAYGESHERNNITFMEHESLDAADQQAMSKEYAESFYQDAECDPDDARFIGTPPRSDEWDDKMRSNQVDRKRGSGGVLNGLYTNSLPEPNYYDKDTARRLRMSYLDSDNKIDIELGSWMKRTDPVRRKRLVANRIKQNITD